MKHEWQKHEKELYGVKQVPAIIKVPSQKFIMISGKGNPNHPDFAERAGVLNSVAWPIKMRYKSACHHNSEISRQCEYEDYTVYPLEGVWIAPEDNPLDKKNFQYTIMVRQPDFITQEMFDQAYAAVKKKKPHPFLTELVFGTMEDGLCIHMLHSGSFDSEPASFAMMDAFAEKSGLRRTERSHREIYLNDARKVQPEKYQTILRYRVEEGNA